MARKKYKGDWRFEAHFYRFGRLVKKLHYKHLDRACERCFGHVEGNQYEATYAEVVDLKNGKVYLKIYHTVDGNIFSMYAEGAQEKIKKIMEMLKPREGEQTE